MADLNNYEELVKKINKIKEDSGLDLSLEEDLSLAIMNLISLEEHFFFTAEKTGRDEYYKLLETVREMRKELLSRLITQTEGEVWCIAKHLLAATMRLMEVGTKMQSKGNFKSAKEMFRKAYQLFNIFFALRLKLVSLPELQKNSRLPSTNAEPMSKEDIMKKLIDCCKE